MHTNFFILSQIFQNGPILCGGNGRDDAAKSCLTLIKGQWVKSHTLKYNRVYHKSWTTPDGRILLIGGTLSSLSTELLNSDGGSDEMFTLRYLDK